MKIRLFDKASLQLGAIGSYVYLMSGVCPCCGKPTMACGAGLGGTLLVGGAIMFGKSAIAGIKNKYGRKPSITREA